MKGALQFIVPILMQTLAKQEDFDDEDDWNPCKVKHIFYDIEQDVVLQCVVPSAYM